MRQRIHLAVTMTLMGVIFLIPSNLFLKVAEPSAYVTGVAIDYLIPKVYASDIAVITLIGLALVWWGHQATNHRRFSSLFSTGVSFFSSHPVTSLIVVGLSCLLMYRQFGTAYPMASLWYLLKIGQMVAFGLALRYLFPLAHPLGTKMALAGTIVFQASVALFQFVMQQPVYGYLFLGEPDVSKTFGIVHASYGGVERVLAYGTTAHPNVVAGVVVVYWLLLAWPQLWSDTKGRFQPWLGWLLLPVLGVLGMTQSVSALLVLLIVGSAMSMAMPIGRERWSTLATKKTTLLTLVVASSIVVAPLLTIWSGYTYPDKLSLHRRAYLEVAAVRLWQNHPWWGVGLNNFTAHVEQATSDRDVSRFRQPVHHLGLLLLAETGLTGVVWLSLILYLASSKTPHTPKTAQNSDQQAAQRKLLFLSILFLPLIVWDHYLVTLQTGLLLLTFTVSYLEV